MTGVRFIPSLKSGVFSAPVPQRDKRAYGNEYPLDDTQQAILVERPADCIILLALNSCWQDEKYDGWLKIAVWHHPVTGKTPMNDEFMQLLGLFAISCG